MYRDEETTGDYWHGKNRNAFIMRVEGKRNR